MVTSSAPSISSILPLVFKPNEIELRGTDVAFSVLNLVLATRNGLGPGHNNVTWTTLGCSSRPWMLIGPRP